MATEVFDQLRTEMMTLSMAERAELADDLIKSLDASRDQGVEEAWERDISRRIELIDSGQAKLLNKKEFRKRMRNRLRTGL